MTFKPDEIRAQIERDRIAREAFRKQARENLRGTKNFASTQNKLLRERDAAVKDALANNVAKYQVPEGTDATGILELTFGNDKGKRSSTLTGEQLAQSHLNLVLSKFRLLEQTIGTNLGWT